MSQFLIQTNVDTGERPANLLATSPDLDHVLTGSIDRTVKYLNPLTYEEEYVGKGHSRGVTTLSISHCIQAQAPIICSGGRDGTICFWAPRKAEVIRKLTPGCAEVKTLSIFQFGSLCYIILGTKDGKVFVYDAASNTLVKTLLGHRSTVLCSAVGYVAPHLDGEPLSTKAIVIATGGKDRTVRVWDFDKGKRRRKLKHPKLVSCLAIAKESIKPVLISGCGNGNLYLWDIKMGIVLRVFEGHCEKVYSVRFWETHEILVASCSGDNTIRVFDALSGECVCTMLGHKRGVKQLEFYTDYESNYTVLVSLGMDRTWRLWDVTAVLNTFFHPPLPDDLPEDADISQYPMGRNDTPADNPDFEYIAKDGKSKYGSTKVFDRDAADDSDGDDDMEADDFDLSEDEGVGEEETGAASGEWHRKKSLEKPQTAENEGAGGKRKSLTVDTVVPSDSKGSLVTTQMSVDTVDLAGSQETSPQPSVSSHSVMSPTSALSPQQLQQKSEALQEQFVAALATVQIQQAREKTRQSENLSLRLSQKRNGSILSPGAGGQSAGIAMTPKASVGEKMLSPTKPLPPHPSSSFASPRGRITNSSLKEGGRSDSDEDHRSDGGDEHHETKERIKKEAELHTSRHQSRMSIAQQRAANRLAQRLTMQSKRKYAKLSKSQQKELQEEAERNSDDDYDGSGCKEEEDDDEDD